MPVTTRSATKKAREQHVEIAPPPTHSVVLLLLMVAVFTKLLPSFDSLDHIATTETFTKRLFPNILSLQGLVMIRASFAIGMLALQIHTIFFSQGWEQTTAYLPNSKLKRHVVIPMKRFRTMMPFTSWAWNLLMASFGCSAWISYKAMVGEGEQVPHYVLRLGILLFEMSAPTALLVAFVVRYGIWPQLLESGLPPDPTAALKHPRTLAWHNANVIMALCEVSLLGGLPVRYGDISMSTFFGIAYILFSWLSMHMWVPSAGPQFLYFFMDTTLGTTTSIALVVLLVVLLVFYGLFCVLHQVLDHLGGGAVLHGLAVVLISSAVCRFRD